MANFRPNIVVRGVVQPWDEDNWGDISFQNVRKLTTGSASMRESETEGECESIRMSVVKPCSRCQVPNLDPATGIADPQSEPSRTLKKFHCGKHMNLQSNKFLGEVGCAAELSCTID